MLGLPCAAFVSSVPYLSTLLTAIGIMPPARRKNLIASRRRRQDEGEEEGSVAGDFDDDSISEGSAASNGDGAVAAGSDSSDDEQESTKQDAPRSVKSSNRHNDQSRDAVLSTGRTATSNGISELSAVTQAISHGTRETDHSQEKEDSHVSDQLPSTEVTSAQNESAVPTAPRHETLAQRTRREHQEYIKQRNANPAFVPNRGGFFLHDDRSANSNGPPRPFVRGRGRGYGPAMQAGYVFPRYTD